MILKNMGAALRYCIPQMIGRKVGEFWELIKPLVDFKYEVRVGLSFTMKEVSIKVIETRMNSMFELATQDEIDKLKNADGTGGDSSGKSSEELELDDLEVTVSIWFFNRKFQMKKLSTILTISGSRNLSFLGAKAPLGLVSVNVNVIKKFQSS